MWRKKYDNLRAEQSVLKKTIDENGLRIVDLNLRHASCVEAREYMQAFSEQIQSELEIHIGETITSALNSIWDEPMKFKANFISRRNQIECDLTIADKDGNEAHPRQYGGGVVNLSSMCLRPTVWHLANNTRNVFLLDEPLHFLHSPALQRRASQLIRELCERNKLQIIMVCDQDDICSHAHKVFRAGKVKGKTVFHVQDRDTADKIASDHQEEVPKKRRRLPK